MPISESQIQEQIAGYLRLQYPNVLFHSDYGSGVRLTPRQAVIQKRQQGGRRAWPDIFIAEPSGLFAGAFLELKREGVRIRKKNGELVADKHIREQDALLTKLAERGYFAAFACGFDEAKNVIDYYLRGVKRKEEND